MRKGKRGRGAAGKVPVFGLLKRAGKVHAVMIADTRSETLAGNIRRTVRPDSVIYTDAYRSYDVLDVSEFRHHRINHGEAFVAQGRHINGIENFWNQAKRHLRRYNGIPRAHFHLFLKQWRVALQLPAGAPAACHPDALGRDMICDCGGAVGYVYKWQNAGRPKTQHLPSHLSTYPTAQQRLPV